MSKSILDVKDFMMCLGILEGRVLVLARPPAQFILYLLDFTVIKYTLLTKYIIIYL